MKISISNIAWRSEEEKEVASMMQEMRIKGIEISPGKIFAEPTALKDLEILKYREFWDKRGINIIALQALLFARPDLTLFESESKRVETLRYLKRLIEIGYILGAKVLVFGSPKNRKVRNIPRAKINSVAFPFFRELGEFALEYNMVFCIEPNPCEYDSDYIVNSKQAFGLIKSVNNNGFGLNLDTGTMTLAKEDASIILKYGNLIRHFHISHPFLTQVSDNKKVKHKEFAEGLRKINYRNWVSVEMKQVKPKRSNLKAIEETLKFVKQVYK
jgi:sugar phosphate isomerase/epimerase